MSGEKSGYTRDVAGRTGRHAAKGFPPWKPAPPAYTGDGREAGLFASAHEVDLAEVDRHTVLAISTQFELVQVARREERAFELIP
jgi:hypothetical protein